ncbi:hypothetical protein PFISCL1PPCAC_12508, partial [Pristionchus fissidentatus]
MIDRESIDKRGGPCLRRLYPDTTVERQVIDVFFNMKTVSLDPVVLMQFQDYNAFRIFKLILCPFTGDIVNPETDMRLVRDEAIGGTLFQQRVLTSDIRCRYVSFGNHHYAVERSARTLFNALQKATHDADARCTLCIMIAYIYYYLSKLDEDAREEQWDKIGTRSIACLVEAIKCCNSADHRFIPQEMLKQFLQLPEDLSSSGRQWVGWGERKVPSFLRSNCKIYL